LGLQKNEIHLSDLVKTFVLFNISAQIKIGR